jgi:AcrR family transcriptional regulator
LEGIIDESLSAAATATPEAGGVLTADESALGERAVRPRAAILEATRKLFLDRGYAGTRINNITDACGISRAGFYTYFRDKREVFTVLGEQSFRDILRVVGDFENLPQPCGIADLAAWVREYFDFMDVHGAFILSSAQSAPEDEEFRTSSARLQMRVAWMLGMSMRGRQRVPTDAPEALGLTINAMLDRAWYFCRGQRLPVDENDMVRTLATTILSTLS